MSEHILVADNLITDIGLDFLDAIGLFYANVRDVTIERNTFRSMPYSAINAGYGFGFMDGPQPRDRHRRYAYENQSIAGDIRIARNLFLDHCTVTDDCGGVYTNSAQPGTIIEHNFFRPQNHEVRWGALFIDEGTTGVLARDNVVVNARDVINIHCDAPEPVTDFDVDRLYYVRSPVPDSNRGEHQIPGVDFALLNVHCNPYATRSDIGAGDGFPRRALDFGGPFASKAQAERPSQNPGIRPDDFIRFDTESALLADPRVGAILTKSGAQREPLD